MRVTLSRGGRRHRVIARLGRPPRVAPRQRLLDVTHAITIETDRFSFVRPLRSLERIPRAGTVIGHDGERPIATLYDDCIAVMPSLSPVRGETAIRLARALPFDPSDRPSQG